jgi:predicted transcriptional regulator
MQEKKIKMFDAEDDDFVACLQAIGVEKKQAKVLAFFRVEKAGTSRDLEQITNLRQPEVSLAVTSLRKRGFINAEQISPKTKRGQYPNKYSLNMPLEDIIQYFWDDALKEWGKKMDMYKKLLKYEIRPFSD